MNRRVWNGWFALLLAGLAAGAGCARRPYLRPDVAAPRAHRADSSLPGTPETPALPTLRWQELVQDEELSRLIAEALKGSLDVQIAAARVLEARAQAAAAHAGRFPALDGLAGYDNSRFPYADVTTRTLSPAMSWELDLWHRLRNVSMAARADLLASDEAFRTVVQSLVGDVAAGYFQLLDLDMEIEITNRALQLRETSLELVRLRVDNGYSSEIEFRQAEVLVKGARAALTSLELQREQTENRISTLLGRNPGPISRGRSLLDQSLLRQLPPGLPSELLDRRPDIRGAEQQLIRDHVLVDVAKAAWFPRLSLTSATGFASSSLAGPGAPLVTWSLAPSAAAPIFRAGAIRAGIDAAEARREQSLLGYRRTVQQAFREVADALAAQQKFAQLRKQQESLAETLRQGVALADLAYKGGVASYLEFLDAERQLLDAELALVQVRRDELINFVSLYRSLGGGW